MHNKPAQKICGRVAQRALLTSGPKIDDFGVSYDVKGTCFAKSFVEGCFQHSDHRPLLGNLIFAETLLELSEHVPTLKGWEPVSVLELSVYQRKVLDALPHMERLVDINRIVVDTAKSVMFSTMSQRREASVRNDCPSLAALRKSIPNLQGASRRDAVREWRRQRRRRQVQKNNSKLGQVCSRSEYRSHDPS